MNRDTAYAHSIYQIMGHKSFPEFETPTTAELPRLWRQHPDPALRRLMLGIERIRRLFVEIEAYRVVVEQCWREEARGQLVALEKLRIIMETERSRLWTQRSEIPAAPDGSADRSG
ncbi:hypothetical protein G3N95_01635 [Paraburkholderia sp. Tr-20389]|uniref:hypothetical protein n=1 Tax=Paraburkholderia sp. Tr-20389 TaxID=2703903 RepID=UPI00197DC1A4|nr:hypothetical protein [Paraburkholderia sp. Tr-20389]MBN3751624.1 hypothetical protein [Paraburkholderia sp. Tr-20389]